MGSPLAPVLANLFMEHHEKLWLEIFHGSTILFYRRYVDHTLLVNIFSDHINLRHPNIKFTMEKQVNHKLPFLDVLIDNHDSNSSLTRVNRKKTFTGLLIISASPRTLRKIKTLVDRAYKINNTWLGFHVDIDKLTDILKKKNLFPAHLTVTSLGPKAIIIPGVPFPPLHLPT